MKIVTFGGGSSQPELIKHLKDYDNLEITAVFSVADSGGSTGVLRDELGVLPPGDLRRGLIALATENLDLAKAMAYRHQEGFLSGHNFGNLLISTLEKSTGDFNQGVKVLEQVLKTKGRCLPVSLQATNLKAELEDGQIIEGETNIDIPKHDSSLKITKLWLEPEVQANPEVITAIKEADLIIYCPGDLYTSLLPNLLVTGVSEALQESKAKKLYTSNLTTKPGETQNFTLSDYITEIEKYTACKVDYVTANILKLQAAKGYQLVETSLDDFKNHSLEVIKGEFAAEDCLCMSEEKLSKAIYDLCQNLPSS